MFCNFVNCCVNRSVFIFCNIWLWILMFVVCSFGWLILIGRLLNNVVVLVVLCLLKLKMNWLYISSNVSGCNSRLLKNVVLFMFFLECLVFLRLCRMSWFSLKLVGVVCWSVCCVLKLVKFYVCLVFRWLNWLMC